MPKWGVGEILGKEVLCSKNMWTFKLQNQLWNVQSLKFKQIMDIGSSIIEIIENQTNFALYKSS